MFIIDKDAIDEIDLEKLRPIVGASDIDPKNFFVEAGVDHFKFLCYVSKQYEGRDIFDIGTSRGGSAIALSYSLNNQIYSFDIERVWNWIPHPNISYNVEDLMDPQVRAKWEEKLLGSAVIFLDIDPHEGSLEYQFYLWLKEKRYAGLLLCDDIHHFKGMRDNFWSKVPDNEKTDITHVGHWSGTGIIQFT